jgi:ParB-like chromosome segregation protein Spo0J
MRSLLEYEFKLRKGQAVQALNDMRSRLISQTREYKHRGKVTGVRVKTRSGTRVANIQAEVDRAADQYRAARAALLALGPRLQRKDYAHLRVLNAADVRGRPSTVFGDNDRRKKGGKRKKKTKRMGAVDPEAAAEEAEVAKQNAEDGMEMSWIWKVEGATGEDKDVVDNEGESHGSLGLAGTDILFSKRCGSNGLKRVRRRCVTWRKRTCWRRKCAACCSSSSGVAIGGGHG